MPEEITDATGVADEVVESTEPGWVNPTDEGGEVEAEQTSPTYKVKVGGEEFEVSLDEALQGYQRQEDYTRKTQELASQRTELDYAARLAMALEADPQSAIEALRQAYEVNGAPAAAAAVIDDLDPEEARYASLESRVVAQEQAAFERQITAQLGDLHTRFGQFDDVELVKFAVERNIPDLEDAAKVFTFDKTFTKIAADRTAAAAKATAPPVAGGHSVASGAVTSGAQTEKPTVREALEAAVAAHS